MQWIEHIFNLQDSPPFAELIKEFGVEAYGVWWVICEKIGSGMKKPGRGSLRLLLKDWLQLTRLSVEKFKNIIKFLADHELIVADYDGDYLTISSYLSGGDDL